MDRRGSDSRINYFNPALTVKTTITPLILSQVAEICEQVGRLDAGLTRDPRTASSPHLRKNNRIRSIHSSLAIENNTLSLDQVTEAFFLINGDSRFFNQSINLWITVTTTIIPPVTFFVIMGMSYPIKK